jgi:hypothetical protein
MVPLASAFLKPVFPGRLQTIFLVRGLDLSNRSMAIEDFSGLSLPPPTDAEMNNGLWFYFDDVCPTTVQWQRLS